MSVNVDNATIVQAIEELEGYAKVARAPQRSAGVAWRT